MGILLALSTGLIAQEICDNGIDDDNDGLIDLNDEDCNCIGPIPFTSITGSVCQSSLFLILDDPDAIAYQWYKDGIAIPDKNDLEINIRRGVNSDGVYNVVVFKADGCYISEDHVVMQPIYYTVLDSINICKGDTVLLGAFELTPSNSADLTISFYAEDGCDSIVILPVYVDYPQNFSREITICKETTYDFYGSILNQSGEYQAKAPTQFGCDSIINLTLKMSDIIEYDMTAEICEGESFIYNDINTSQAGIHETLVSNSLGCDSMISVDLKVISKTESYEFVQICKGDVFSHLDIEETETGLYESKLINAAGCDSIVKVDLEVLEHSEVFLNENICEGNTYTYLDIEESTAGLYETIITAANGCDSIIMVELSVGTEVNILMEEKICAGETFIFRDIEKTQEGIYETVIPGPMGCDSFFTVDLAVLSPSSEEQFVNICEGETFVMHDLSESNSGDYEIKLINNAGCDSTLFIHLDVEPLSKTTVQETFCEGDLFAYNEIETFESGVFESKMKSLNGCDSIIIVELEMLPLNRETRQVQICAGETFEYEDVVSTESGTFETYKTNQFGCDSLITFELDVKEPGDGFQLPEVIDLTLGNSIDIIPDYNDNSLIDFNWTQDSHDSSIGTASTLYEFGPIEDTWVYLEAHDENGCEARGSVLVQVNLDFDVYIPNVMFGDNREDDINGRFVIGASKAIKGIKDLHIFDRFGEMVFTDQNIKDIAGYQGWDGKFNGKHVEQGVYTYVITFSVIDGSESVKAGSITVL